MNCPDRNLLLAFRSGELSETPAEDVITHISVCPACQAALQNSARLTTLWLPNCEVPLSRIPTRTSRSGQN